MILSEESFQLRTHLTLEIKRDLEITTSITCHDKRRLE